MGIGMDALKVKGMVSFWKVAAVQIILLKEHLVDGGHGDAC